MGSLTGRKSTPKAAWWRRLNKRLDRARAPTLAAKLGRNELASARLGLSRVGREQYCRASGRSSQRIKWPVGALEPSNRGRPPLEFRWLASELRAPAQFPAAETREQSSHYLLQLDWRLETVRGLAAPPTGGRATTLGPQIGRHCWGPRPRARGINLGRASFATRSRERLFVWARRD